MKKLLTIIFLLFFCFSFSQDYEESKSDGEFKPNLNRKGKQESPFFKRAFTIPLSSLLDNTASSINVGFEQSINKRLGLYTMIGYANNYFNPFISRNRIYNGLKVGFEPRYYLARNRQTAIFLTPALFYKALFEKHNDEFVNRQSSSYSQALSFREIVNELNLIAKFGLQKLKMLRSVGLEFSFSIGVLFHFKKFIDLPEDASLIEENPVPYNPYPLFGRGLSINPALQITLGILIAGKQRRY